MSLVFGIWLCLSSVLVGAVAGVAIDAFQERRLHREDERIIEAELRRLIPEAYEENAS